MTEEAAVPVPKKRRTAAELRAYHLAEAKKAEEREKMEVLRLVSDAHDTLTESMSLEAHKPHAPAFQQAQKILKDIIGVYTPKK